MAKIYLPSPYHTRPCKVIFNDYIRVYNTTNVNQTNVIYDIYINQDYMVKQGTATYTTSVVCDTLNTYTDDYFYRVDIVNILLYFILILMLLFAIPFYLFKRFFGRFR